MELQRGNIVLKRLTFSDIELVRQWRNSSEVNAFMEFRGQISPEAQQAWFHGINNGTNLYFIILVNDIPIGLIYGADIDWTSKTVGNAGIFIALPMYREATFALSASLLLNDFAFALGIECIYIKVLRDNIVAQQYNKHMGYCLLPGQELVSNQTYRLRMQDYFSKASFLREISRTEVSFQLKVDGNVSTVKDMSLTHVQKQQLAHTLGIAGI